MKFKPTHTPGKIIVELDRNDALPADDGLRQNPPAFGLKNILVPIDFSDCSKKALFYALPYAKEFGAQVTLLYVAQFHYAASEWDSAEMPVLEDQHIKRAKNELLKLVKELPDSIKTRTAVVSGKPFQEIVATAKALNSDLIIIGTHGAMNLQHAYLGSTAERVARFADCPVLIVRQRERDFVPTDRAKKAAGNCLIKNSAA